MATPKVQTQPKTNVIKAHQQPKVNTKKQEVEEKSWFDSYNSDTKEAFRLTRDMYKDMPEKGYVSARSDAAKKYIEHVNKHIEQFPTASYFDGTRLNRLIEKGMVWLLEQ